MDTGALHAALDIITLQMRETEREFEQLKFSRDHLQAAHMNIMALLKDRSASPVEAVHSAPPVEITSDVPLPTEGKPSWRIVRDVFPRSGGSLTVPEIHKLVNAHGDVIPNPDAIRIAMRRHPEVFKNIGGRYSLIDQASQEGGASSSNAEEATEVAS